MRVPVLFLLFPQNFGLKVDLVGMKPFSLDMRITDLAGTFVTFVGKYHFSRDAVFNETIPGHLSPTRGLVTNHSLLPPPSPIADSSSDCQNSSKPPPHTHTPIPVPTIADIVHNRDLITRIT